MAETSSLSITNSVFEANMALNFGVFKISGQSSFGMTGTQFLMNQAEVSNSIGQIIQSVSNSFFKEVTF